MTAGAIDPSPSAADRAPGTGKKQQHKRGAIRDNLEAFGVAILAAVLLKYFAIEAFQIPTSSMQPTMMGCVEAGVYDRLLVDKVRYRLTEPQRWDILVFHYPLQQNQNYVKRMVGKGGDRLNIAGGNLYQVKGDGADRTFEVLRKPDRIQGNMWREVYPYRRMLREDDRAIGTGKSFFATPGNRWREQDDVIVATLDEGSTNKLVYSDETDGGMIDRVWDGYTVAVGRDMRNKYFKDQRPQEIVPDVKFEVGLQPEGALGECAFEIEVRRPDMDTLIYALSLQGGKGRLLVRKLAGEPLASSPEFPCEVPAGTTTSVGFARLDDMLIAFRGGDEIQTFDVAQWHTREGCELGAPAARSNHCVNAQIVARGKGKLQLHDLRLWRDEHYVRSTRGKDEIIEVPDGCYFMMGDNTLQSIDSRDWMAFSVGVLPDGRMVPPEDVLDVPRERIVGVLADGRKVTPEEARKVPGGRVVVEMPDGKTVPLRAAPKLPGARVVRGNKRVVPPSSPPDRDETPVVFPDRKELVMIDEYGEILRLKSGISPAYGTSDGHNDVNFVFEPIDSSAGNSDWTPPTEHVAFVKREHVVGRALVAFWPIWPFAKQTRLGFYR